MAGSDQRQPDRRQPVAALRAALRASARAVNRARHPERHPPTPAEPPQAHPEAEPHIEGVDLLRRASDTAWRFIVIGVVVVVLLYALTYISTVVVPTILALFLTALLMPMAKWLRRYGLGRGSSTAITFLGSLLVFGLVIYFIVNRAIAGVPALLDSVADAVAELQGTLTTLGLDVAVVSTFLQQVQDEIQGWLTDTLQDNYQQLLSGAWTAAVGVGQLLFAIVLILVLTVYFIHSGDRLMAWVGTLLPHESRRTVQSSAEVAYDVMGRYVRGVALVGLFDAVGIGLMLIGLSMFDLLDPNLAIPLIVLTFIGAFLPVVGAVITGALAALVVWVTAGWVIGLVVLIWVIFIQQLESNVFAPRIYGRALELPSPVVLLGISVGAILGNLFGMFLATPVLAVVTALLRNRNAATDDEDEDETERPSEPGQRAGTDTAEESAATPRTEPAPRDTAPPSRAGQPD